MLECCVWNYSGLHFVVYVDHFITVTWKSVGAVLSDLLINLSQ